MDNFQDLLSTVEDKNITGYTETLAWKENDHHPINGEHRTITGHFDHECKERNPKHTICFPQVGAHSREVTFPVANRTDMQEFQHISSWLFAKVVQRHEA